MWIAERLQRDRMLPGTYREAHDLARGLAEFAEPVVTRFRPSVVAEVEARLPKD